MRARQEYQNAQNPGVSLGSFRNSPQAITASTYQGQFQIVVATNDATVTGGTPNAATACFSESAGPVSGHSSFVFGIKATHNDTKCQPGFIANAPGGKFILPSAADGAFLFAGGTATSPLPGSYPFGIEVDGDGAVWVANNDDYATDNGHGLYANNASISTFGINGSQFVATSSVNYLHDLGSGGTLRAPGPLAIDRSGNVWTVSSFVAGYQSTALVLSELVGAAAPTLTPIALANLGPVGGSGPATGTRPTN